MSHTVLVVDDDDAVRSILAASLNSLGFQVEVAPEGSAALNLMGRKHIDLLVTDIIMPDREGVETIIEVRRRWPNCKIIAISGGGRVDAGEFLELARTFGAHATLRKPFKRAELLEALAEVLEVPVGEPKADDRDQAPVDTSDPRIS